MRLGQILLRKAKGGACPGAPGQASRTPNMRERRKVPRYPFGMTGTFHPPGEGVGTRVVVRVVSTKGCAIEGADGPGVGKKCELYIDWRGAQIGVEGQVVSKDMEGRIGLKFLSVDKDIQMRLSDLCNTLRTQSVSASLAAKVDTDRSLSDSATARQSRPSGRAATPPPRSAGPARAHERRRVPRYVSELRARISDPATGASSNVTLVTLSVLGGCFEGPGLPAAGQKCEVNTEWEGRPLRMQGTVVWSSKERRLGVKFASLDEGAEKLLRQICANLRLQPMAPLPPEPE